MTCVVAGLMRTRVVHGARETSEYNATAWLHPAKRATADSVLKVHVTLAENRARVKRDTV